MTNAVRFWDRAARKYAQSPIKNEAAYQDKLERTRAYLGPDMMLLEFGCGTGSTAIAHAPHVARITATDISEEMLAIGREKAAAAGVTNIEFRQADVDSYAGDPESADVVLALSVLHLLRDPGAAVARMSGLLKPGGRLVTSTACIAEMACYIRLALPVMRWVGYAPFVHVFASDDLRGFFTRAGLEIEEDWRPAPGEAVFIIARKPQ
ncbi:MAG: class I SAM-dependent methyltransferase [Pseudomonadota bacterium]